MNTREVIPLKQGLDFKLTLPGSKSITNRAFLCAALAKGKGRLYGSLDSDDTRVMTSALKKVGVKFKKLNDSIEITGIGGGFKKGNYTFDLHNAGTATRFLTAVMAVREGETVITGDKRMQERPIADLVEGLGQLGCNVEYLGREGYPPLKISNSQSPISNREFSVRMNGNKSSQYFSALLMLGPLLPKPLKIEVVGELVSKPYIDITINVMKAFGVEVKNNDYKSFTVKPQQYKATDYWIEGDASAASYWTSMAFLHDGKVGFTNLPMPFSNTKIVHNKYLALKSGKGGFTNKKSIQGDSLYSQVLQKCEMRNAKCEIDMNDMPDVAMTLACTSAFVNGVTKITGLSTLRIKETDRLAALQAELGKIGVVVKTGKDSITIGATTEPQRSHNGATIGTYNDHRMAMCFAVVGTKIPGIVIENPDCVNKTYPKFWEDLEMMYLSKPIKLGQKNLILTGMRCSGKTRHGKRIAKMLGREFVDLDTEIEKQAGIKIPQLVKEKGWDYFRKLESEICKRFADCKELVIATGGGVVMSNKNMKSLKKNGVNVFIFADPHLLSERVSKKTDTRPSLTGKKADKEVFEVWKQRRDLYLKYADYVWDNTGGKVVGESLKSSFN